MQTIKRLKHVKAISLATMDSDIQRIRERLTSARRDRDEITQILEDPSFRVRAPLPVHREHEAALKAVEAAIRDMEKVLGDFEARKTSFGLEVGAGR